MDVRAFGVDAAGVSQSQVGLAGQHVPLVSLPHPCLTPTCLTLSVVSECVWVWFQLVKHACCRLIVVTFGCAGHTWGRIGVTCTPGSDHLTTAGQLHMRSCRALSFV